jgi:anti-sigma factor RsiW
MPDGYQTCSTDRIAAFIDGELTAADHIEFEGHVAECARCNTELLAQRQFMCELDSAMAGPFDLAVPRNFAQVVAVRAKSDMRGVRNAVEHRRAFFYCLLLAGAAFGLLGVAASQAVFERVQSIAGKVFGVVELLARAAYDAAVGLTVIGRVFSGGLISDSHLTGLTGVLIMAFAIALLSFLISRYHRARLSE